MSEVKTGMKAGRELDTRLCELLEPEPKAYRVFNPETGQWLTYSISQHGFWNWRDDWYPIDVSTDWAAAGKVIDFFAKENIDIVINRTCWSSPADDPWYIKLTWDENNPDMEYNEASSMSLPHALALAAIEALERRKDED